jgi:hypothetical protein
MPAVRLGDAAAANASAMRLAGKIPMQCWTAIGVATPATETQQALAMMLVATSVWVELRLPQRSRRQNRNHCGIVESGPGGRRSNPDPTMLS